ncbi:hypothetical protein NDU88_003132 [Pleurodeles waltl]|uniref:Uncharacterized protein n=1 Tax=Pleurodeles waltl TaxID=8319 RepID=A0AAV7M2J5_PLEWA|nr:hypothetical protein NDU88_003132 [Pleurodeles waltl]
MTESRVVPLAFYPLTDTVGRNRLAGRAVSMLAPQRPIVSQELSRQENGPWLQRAIAPQAFRIFPPEEDMIQVTSFVCYQTCCAFQQGEDREALCANISQIYHAM